MTSNEIRVLDVRDGTRTGAVSVTALERADGPFHFETAASASEALDRLTDGTVDCVLASYELPGMDGVEFLEAVRETRPDLPFVLFAENGSEAVASEAIAAGVTEYVPKAGSEPEGLAHRIRDAAERYRADGDATDPARVRAIAGDLRDADRAFAGADTSTAVADTAVEALRDLLGASVACLYRHDADEGRLVPVAWTDRTAEPVGEPSAVAPGEGTVGAAFAGEGPCVSDDAASDPEGPTPDTPVRSRIAVPVDEYGVLSAGATDPAAFDAADVSLARLLAVDAATALDRVERRARLREKSNLLEQIFEQVPVHLYVKDDEGRHRYVSERYIGDDPMDPIGKTDRELYPDAGTYEDDMRVIETGEPILNKEEYVPTVGHWNLTSKVPWYDEDGEIAGLIGVTRQIQERKEYEERLKRQNERLDEFASVVSHDLRNPLNVASGRLALAREECDSDALDAVARAHDRMAALIEDLLTLAREGETITDPESVALATTVEASWRDVETADATLVVEAARTIQADRRRLRQLLENLLRNAIEHGGPDVTVTVGDLDDGFYVADDGPGIPESDREAVFAAGHSTTEDGTGFGLNIVREIADAHGWAVAVTESDDGGARFEFTGVTVVD
ncbi:MAG: ATP-binding protein [Haloarculaceae archaeon]